MGPFIMDNGQKMVLEKEKEFNFGKMEANMKVIGKTTKQMDMVDLYMLMVIAIMEIGLMIKLMVEVPMSIWTELSMSVIGKKINNMDMV